MGRTLLDKAVNGAVVVWLLAILVNVMNGGPPSKVLALPFIGIGTLMVGSLVVRAFKGDLRLRAGGDAGSGDGGHGDGGGCGGGGCGDGGH